MALSVFIDGKTRLGPLLPWSWLGLALISTSCTPVAGTGSARLEALPPPIALLDQSISQPAISTREQGTAAAAAPEPQPSYQPAASAFALRGRTPLDTLRSTDCLAQAIYYEAASESEDGQRAVAQVVLNRVRHPSWPNSVCGVVYQGPMRPGGGCQFTFTCDGSLARRPSGEAWARARILAAEALAGRVFAGVGLSTHYHTHAVSPAWAPRLERTTAIGAHNFYRLPGRWGQARAFTAAYSGTEPLPRPSMLLPRPAATAGLAPLVQAARSSGSAANWSPVAVPATVTDTMPAPSTVRDEYRHSGQWREDAPAAVTGR
jgi:spore germination cell wall hydrolase CwlJ-like protein